MFIITGGGSGIGKALAIELANRQQKVLIIGRRESLLSETASSHPAIQTLSADLGTPEGIENVVAFVQREQSIQGLINNAATLDPLENLTQVNIAEWLQTMYLNVGTPLLLTQKLQEKLKHGRVLNLSSGLAHFAAKGMSAYCVSKAALSMLTQCWNVDCPEIPCASVMPGIIDTSMQTILRDNSAIALEHQAWFRALKTQNRLIQPETVALFLSWLLLDTTDEKFSAKEWDIYETNHHEHWLKENHRVPSLDEK